MHTYLLAFLAWNSIVMLIYGADKLKAKRGARRIREASLLYCSFMLGGLGAMFGMVLFNHKTAKIKFRLLVPLSFIVSIAAVYLGLKTVLA